MSNKPFKINIDQLRIDDFKNKVIKHNVHFLLFLLINFKIFKDVNKYDIHV